MGSPKRCCQAKAGAARTARGAVVVSRPVAKRETLARKTRREEFESASGLPRERVYGPENIQAEAGGAAGPGAFPFTRGLYSEGYRTQLWTMRQYAGFATAEESNTSYRYLLEQGTTGLSERGFRPPPLIRFEGSGSPLLRICGDTIFVARAGSSPRHGFTPFRRNTSVPNTSEQKGCVHETSVHRAADDTRPVSVPPVSPPSRFP